MVHRPADSRLLSNLLQQEKEYSKQLSQLLECSNASLASFTAYAAASPPPGSHVIMSVAGSLAGIDEALKRYSQGVDEWRETMRSLKDAEEAVGGIMRDREILVTRLIKASNSKKSGAGNIRESLLLNHQRFPSSSSLSLSIGGESPSPSRPQSGSFSSSTKLAAAQSELQACEAHLAAKERELAVKRCTAVRDGLGARIRALMECGWVWSEVGKEALRVLDELEPEQLPEHRYSIVRQSPPNNPRPVSGCDATTRPSSDFSSIGPSQSASQVASDHDHEEQAATNIHSVMNPAALAEPTSPSIATTTTVAPPPAAPAPAEDSHTTRPRPPSGNSTITTTGSSIHYSVATPATYTLETVTYAHAIPLHVGGSGALVSKGAEREKEKDEGKEKENASTSSSVVPSGSPYAPISYAMFKDEDLHTTMRIPAPHAIEGYAPGIPTAGPSTGGFDQYGGYSTPRSRPSSGVGMPQPQPQPINLDDGKRRKLDKKITEEEPRRSYEKEEEDDASSFEDVKIEKKLVKEGKIEVVENPRFMTEARRKELERARRQKKEEPTPMKEEKKKFSLFPHHRKSESQVAIQQPAVEREQQASSAPSAVPPPSEAISGTPLKATGSPSKQPPSPSKGWFLSGLKGFFGPRQLSTPQNSPVRRRSKRATTTAIVNSGNLVSDDSDVEDGSPSKSKGGGGFQALFGKSPAKPKAKSGQWETRTNKNIREIASERRGTSFDGVSPRGVGLGIAGGAVKDVGVVTPAGEFGSGGKRLARGRTVSDVTPSRRPPTVPSSSAAPVPSTSASAVPSGPGPASTPRKLKKPRAGGGPPVSGSAAGAGEMRRLGAGGGGENWSTASVASSSNIAPTPATLVATAATPVAVPSAAPRPRTPTRALSTNAATGPAKSRTRRSASVDVASRSRAELEEKGGGKEGETIVDLGRRRRTTSDVGGVKEKEKVPPMPTDSPVRKTAPSSLSKGYFSDTGAANVVRNDSTKKAQTTQAPAPVDPVAQNPKSTSTPSKKASIKSSASTPSKSPGVSSLSGTPAIHATVLPAGGENPSGTLVPYPGWDAQAQARGGSLSRHTSSGSMASASAVGVRAKSTILGQGSKLVRGASVGSTSGPVGIPGDAQGTSSAAVAKRDVAAARPPVHPTPAGPSLMSIVEDVSRTNRGWSEDLKMRKSVGGSKTAAPNLLDGMLVRAPPPMPRGALETLNVAEMFGTRGSPASSTVGSVTKPTTTTTTSKGTGMFEIKAPGSVFDHRHAMTTAITTIPPSTATPSATSTTQTKPQKQQLAPAGVERRSTVVKKADPTSSTSTPSSASAKGKSPLRSAMRSTSRSPSPMTTAGPSNVQHRDAKPPLSNGSTIVSAHGTQQQQHQQQRKPKQERKGKTSARPGNPKDSGGDGDEDGDSTSTVFYSDQGESVKEKSAAASASEGEGEATTKPVVMNGSAVPTAVNGHRPDGVYEKWKSDSEISHSTVSTVVGGSSGQQQQEPHAESSRSPPRRRKSVRVSLKPTFSPSPPAIEYDYEEEHQRYAVWGRKDEGEEGFSPSRLPPPPLPLPAPVVAPTPVHASPAQHRLVGERLDAGVADMWEDSGEDEDEEYTRAKRLLTRAAKRNKDVNLMIAKGRA